jgi:tetraacyldisaccharide 4'-kinase
VSVPAWLSRLTLQAVETEDPTPGQRVWRGVLGFAAAGYGAAVAARNAGYGAGLLPNQPLSCRVISVGNLTVGGTGKTPAVITLAQRLSNAGSKVCVLLRGYGRAGEGPGVVSDGREIFLSWRQAGDEAVLLARRLPGVPILVGGDRIQSGRLALRQFGPDTILLDDGFQHRRVHRDLDLLLLDATDPFGGERLLPRGRLREHLSGLRRAHAILVTRADQAADLDALRGRLKALAPGIPVALAVHRADSVMDLHSGEKRPPDVLREERVFAVSGIATPRSFHRTLLDLGAAVVGSLVFPDHHPFGAGDRGRMAREAREAGATCLVTTEKDAVRLEGALPPDIRVLALGIRLEVIQGLETLDRLLAMGPSGGRRG